MAEQLVRYATDAGFATVTLDSPKNRNAISLQLLAELRAALAAAAADPDVRAVVLTHTGTTFSAGADLSEAGRTGTDPAELLARSARDMAALLREIVAHPKPIVAEVNGNVRAGGMGIVAACDIAVAGPTSTFGLTEARLGVAIAIISLTVLHRMDARAAGRYVLTSEIFGPAEAQATGLITMVAEHPESAVRALLAELGKQSPQGLAESKRVLARDLLDAFDRHADELCDTSARLFATDEAREGITAMFQRRPARWVLSG
ncbi:enoyl-CoA hydratase family protein [Skermania piniformis]|uniref:Enoyl-CoA hydratase family protein n=1 Tax=Skermania pinensis TaxID=39122 RepID=A0ABX8SBZ6_9ACTN|nr:enoyl-CoA hydratase family protein [Skermania piniformis]QXQ14492.1 enoyl-CoA hydratase family protein [Skermania piniformis]